MSQPINPTAVPTIHIMTADLKPGDAVSNFAVSCQRILRSWGVRAYLYADHVAPEMASVGRHSRYYQPTGHDLLWFHYSIYADNLNIALASPDYKLLDFHGICPPRLFHGQNEHLAAMCQKGLDLLPSLHNQFDGYVVHSEYSRDWLQGLNFPADKIQKIFYCIDTSSFTGEDAELAASLAKLDYFLMVGRIVPQKDLLALIDIFSHIHQAKPDAVLVVVGTRQQTDRYQQQIDTAVRQKRLQHRVLFTDHVSNPAVLAALFRQARFLLVTSEWESFCVPIAESLYFGTPTAVHHLPPMPEVAGPGGVLFDKADPAAAAQQLLSILDDDGRYQQLRQSARQWADQYADTALAHNLQQLLATHLPYFGQPRSAHV